MNVWHTSAKEGKEPIYSAHPRTWKQRDRKARGEEGEKETRMNQEFMTKRRSQGFAGCCFNKLVRLLCWILSFLCASTNEIRVLIILTLSKGYDWDLCYLNHIYVPILTSVCSLQDTHYIRLLTVHVAALHDFIAVLAIHKWWKTFWVLGAMRLQGSPRRHTCLC